MIPDFTSSLFIILASTGLSLLVIGFFVTRRPPRSINAIYGYRTKKSMASQEAWDFAQIFSTRLMIRSAWLMIALSALSLFLRLGETTGVLIGFVIIFALLVYPIIETEKALKDKFG